MTDSLGVLQEARAHWRGSVSAPGSAFGPQGEGFVRWCFAASEKAARRKECKRLRLGLGILGSASKSCASALDGAPFIKHGAVCARCAENTRELHPDQ
jgi:hypothetical protein